jgi:hypothetical protein
MHYAYLHSLGTLSGLDCRLPQCHFCPDSRAIAAAVYLEDTGVDTMLTSMLENDKKKHRN